MLQNFIHFMIDIFKQHADAWISAIGPSLLGACGVVLLFVYRKSLIFIPRKKKKDLVAHEKPPALPQPSIQAELAEAHLQNYLRHVVTDPHISQIHTASMNHPLQLLDVYIQLRVHSESSHWYTLDPVLRDAEETQEPDALLLADQEALRKHISEVLEPEEALRRHKHCVIVGDPGSGKTTLQRYLTLQSAQNKLDGLPALPIYAQISTFDLHKHQDLTGLLLAQLGDFAQFSSARSYLHEKMLAGSVLLLLDGLDETKVGTDDQTAETAYVAMIDAIKKLAARYPEMPIMVTVRKAGYQHRPKLQGFYELELIDFSRDESKAFIINWFNANNPSNREEKIIGLQTHLERSLRLQSLATNPLLLSLIVIVYDKHIHLPERRADLYKQCIEELQSKWDASRDIKRQREFPLIFQSQLLQEVAWYFHNQNKRYFQLEELLQVIGHFLPTVDIVESKSRDVLEQIAIENGLLREQAKDWYGFSHLTFQEYFVTQYIISHQCQELLFKHLYNPWWEEVLLLYVGAIHDASQLLRTLLGQNELLPLSDDLFLTHLILAGRCLAEKPRLQQTALRDTIIDQLQQALLTNPYLLTRERIARVLAMMNIPRVNNRLLHILAGQEATALSIREHIGRALGHSGDPALASELVSLLTQPDLERVIRIVISRALANLTEASVVPTLLILLRNKSEDPFVRQSVAETLGLLGKKYPIPSLIEICQDKDENALVLQSIVIALGTLGDRQVLPTLYNMLITEQLDWHVRGNVAKVLAKLGQQEVVPLLLQVLEDKHKNTYVRRCIALAIGNIKCAESLINHLLTLLNTKALDYTVRGSIATAFATIEDKTVAPSLLGPLDDPETPLVVRMQLAITLGLLNNNSYAVMHILKKLYHDQECDYDLWACIVAARGMLGLRTVLPELLDLIVDLQLPQDILPHIVQALICLSAHNSIDNPDTAQKLVKLLETEKLDRYRGQSIVKVLSALRDVNTIPALIELLGKHQIDRYIRQSIAEAVSHFAQEREHATQLAALLPTTDIADDVYRSLWIVSRHATKEVH